MQGNGSDPSKDLIRENEQVMLEALGIQSSGQHCPCPVCKDTSSLRVGLDRKESRFWLCQCMKCDRVKGDVFSVYQQVLNKDFVEAIKILREKMGLARPSPGTYTRSNGIRKIENVDAIKPLEIEAPAPQINQSEAEDFVQAQHEFLMNSTELVHTYMKGKRGISEEVAQKYRLGFLHNTQIKLWSGKKKDWFNTHVKAAWVLPVADQYGKLKAVKIHHEIVPEFDGKKYSKCFWMPFGVERKAGADSYNCFWPHLNSQTKNFAGINFSDDYEWWLNQLQDGALKDQFFRVYEHHTLFLAGQFSKTPEELEPNQLYQARTAAFEELQKEIKHEVLSSKRDDGLKASTLLNNWTIWAPGELKAFAYISAGIQATALTTGESFVPSSGLLRCFRGRRVAINWDADVPRDNGAGKPLCTGREFVQKVTLALKQANVREVRVFTFGRK